MNGIDRVSRSESSQDLRDALDDLGTAVEDANEEDYPAPSPAALSSANRVLREMYVLRQMRYEVYPTPDAEIAIVAPGGRRRSVMVLCGPDEGALCMVNLNGDHRRARYSTSETLPDEFLREALEDLARYER